MSTSNKIRLLPPAATKALLAIDGPAAATFNTIIEAQNAYEGGAGNDITLALAVGGTWVPCVGTLTFTGNAVADETVTIGTTVYTWKAAPGATPFAVLVGANAAASIVNLAAAINLNGTAGTTYGTGTTIHPTVRAHDGAGDTLVVHTKPAVLAAAGTLLASTQTMTNATWAAATLADGTDGTNVTFSVAGTAISCVYAASYSNVADFEAALAADATVSALIRVKTAGTTPLYQLVVTDDDFAATNLTGGGSTTVAAPTLTSATAGVALPFLCDQALVLVRNVDNATSVTKTISPILWGYNAEAAEWFVIGALNAGVAIAETSADAINYAELVVGLRGFSRLYCQLAVSGAGVEAEVLVIPFRAETVTR